MECWNSGIMQSRINRILKEQVELPSGVSEFGTAMSASCQEARWALKTLFHLSTVLLFPGLLSGFAVLALCGFGMTHSPQWADSKGKVDTTSGNIVWNVDTIGAKGSTLYDCCVINDTLAYAVGWIMPHDSAEQSHSLDWYNAAVWNGERWTPFQVPVYYDGRKTFSPIHSVFARSKDDVWFGMYYMVHWDGHRYFQIYPGIGSWENKIWESADGSTLYAVGDYGMISYSANHGRSWTPIRTGTMLPYQDVWGNGGRILAVASDDNGHQYLVGLKGDSAIKLNEAFPFVRSLSGIWFGANRKYFAVGNNIYEDTNIGNKVWHFDPFIWHINHYIAAVRGNSSNDVFMAGQDASLAHWNGRTWKVCHAPGNRRDQLRSISVKGNLVVAVGQRYYSNIDDYGVIYTGIRETPKKAGVSRPKGGYRRVVPNR